MPDFALVVDFAIIGSEKVLKFLQSSGRDSNRFILLCKPTPWAYTQSVDKFGIEVGCRPPGGNVGDSRLWGRNTAKQAYGLRQKLMAFARN